MNRYDTNKRYIAFPHGDNPVIRREICIRLMNLGWRLVEGLPADRTTICPAEGILYATGAGVSESGNSSHHVGSLDKLFNTDFYRYKLPFYEEVGLNDNHSAVVTDSVVKVGCQEFSFDVIEKLHECVQRAKTHRED